MENQKIVTVKSLLSQENVKAKFEQILKEGSNGFIANLAVMVNNNKMLSKCDPITVISAATIAASLKLQIDPNLGQAGIIPYNSKDGKVKAQFQIQYKGYKQLAIRSGQFERLEWCRIYKNDTEEDIKNRLKSILKTAKDEEIIGYAHYFKLLNGFESYFSMTVDEIKKHAKKYSQAFRSGQGLWIEDFEKMAKKTVIKLHLNSGDAPLSIEMQKAAKFDQAVIKDAETEEVDYIDGNEILFDHTIEEQPKAIDIEPQKSQEGKLL